MLTFCQERKTKNFGKTLQALNHINQGLRLRFEVRTSVPRTFQRRRIELKVLRSLHIIVWRDDKNFESQYQFIA